MKQKTLNETKKIRKPRGIRTRRVIKLMFKKCPICFNRISKMDPNVTQEQMTKFAMVQFASNPDGTGYESYYCGSCKKFCMMIISPTPIMAQPNFVTGMGGAPQQGQEKPRDTSNGNGDVRSDPFGV